MQRWPVGAFVHTASCCLLIAGFSAAFRLGASPATTGTQLAASLRQLSLDPDEAYRVRDVSLARGDIKLHLNEGILCFAKPVDSRYIAAVFLTDPEEGGDGEVIVFPPKRSERLSLSNYTKSPNLDEHFRSAFFLFTDDTRNEVLNQLKAAPIRKAPAQTIEQIDASWQTGMRAIAGDLDVNLVRSLLDNHAAQQGLFYGVVGGSNLGTFDLVFNPHEAEPVLIGRSAMVNQQPSFETWASFLPRRGAEAPREPVLADYRIDVAVGSDLVVKAVSRFKARPSPESGRVLAFDLSSRMHVESATVDGVPVETFQHATPRGREDTQASTFLLILPETISAGREQVVEVTHQGDVIRRTSDGAYLVQARNQWFPYTGANYSNFDLTFHVPKELSLISTGELVEEHVSGNDRVVHRQTRAPVRFAGFNLGHFAVDTRRQDDYRIECFSPPTPIDAPPVFLTDPRGRNTTFLREQPQRLEPLCNRVGGLLAEYTRLWGPAAVKTVAISPIPGYIGQGFPGLVYLSTMSFANPSQRPFGKDPLIRTFFDDLLPAHELAHQWWGNLVTAADYRSEWIIESLANYSALELLAKTKGKLIFNQVLASYRNEMLTPDASGKQVEGTGPLEMGARLRSINPQAWRVITYDKGTWVIYMLQQRMGPVNFLKFEQSLIKEFNNRPLTNEDFRSVASRFLPAGLPDRKLEAFFDTWVYSTGIPEIKLSFNKQEGEWTISQEGVDEDFAVDVPLQVTGGAKTQQTKWLRLSSSGASYQPDAVGATTLKLPPQEQFLYRQAGR